MKKALENKAAKRLNLQTSKIEAYGKANFRHRDRGIHSGRARNK